MSNDQIGMLATAATTLSLGWSIVIAVVPLVISALALIGGWVQQSKARTHERDRLDTQLAHDRELADLEDVRRVLDEAARALDRASWVRPVRAGGLIARDPEELAESEQEIGAARLTCEALLARLRVRLGQNKAVTKNFEQATEALREIQYSATLARKVLDEALEEGVLLSRHQADAFARASDKFRYGVDAFFDAAVQHAGTRIGDEPPDDRLSTG